MRLDVTIIVTSNLTDSNYFFNPETTDEMSTGTELLYNIGYPLFTSGNSIFFKYTSVEQ